MSDTIVIETENFLIDVLEESTTLTATEEVIEVVGVGIQGPAGPSGTSGDKSFSQPFTSLASVTVTHNLGKYPAVTVIDSAGDEVVGDVDHITTNQLTVSFSAPNSGTVICN